MRRQEAHAIEPEALESVRKADRTCLSEAFADTGLAAVRFHQQSCAKTLDAQRPESLDQNPGASIALPEHPAALCRANYQWNG